jgi:hypothetical protein
MSTRRFGDILCVTGRVMMTAMVHEQMHQWAGRQEQPGKRTQHVGGVLRQEKEGGDR